MHKGGGVLYIKTLGARVGFISGSSYEGLIYSISKASRGGLCSNSSSRSSSSSSSSRTDRWVHFQQNVGLRVFVHTWILHGIDDCYQLTRTFGEFSAQCLSKLFLKEFTVVLVATSFGRAFQVGAILIG